MKALLTRAEAEAVQSGDDLPGPEHLLLSAIELPDGTASAAFGRLGVDPNDFRSAVDRAHRDALGQFGVAVSSELLSDLPGAEAPSGPYRMTSPGQQVFQRAFALAKETKPSLLRSAHVVVAVCEQDRGTVARALQAQGIDRERLAAAAREALAAG